MFPFLAPAANASEERRTGAQITARRAGPSRGRIVTVTCHVLHAASLTWCSVAGLHRDGDRARITSYKSSRPRRPARKLVFNLGVCRAERNDQMIGQFSDHLLSLKGFRFGGMSLGGFCRRAELTADSSRRNNRHKAAGQDGRDRRSTSAAIERLALLTTYSELARRYTATR